MSNTAIPSCNPPLVPPVSPAVEQALRELLSLPVAEACLSGICDICLAYGTELCNTVQPGRGKRPA